jgi:hypothetical protein
LGSLFFFYFADCSSTGAIEAKLKGLKGINFTGNDFRADLPYFRQAFQEVLLDLEIELEKLADGLTPGIIEMVSELCEPDPNRRGNPKNIGTSRPQHSLERYVSRLNLLARRTELSLQ